MGQETDRLTVVSPSVSLIGTPDWSLMESMKGYSTPTVPVLGEYVAERTRGSIFWVTEPDTAGDIAGSSVVAVICGAPLSFFAVKVLIAFPNSSVLTVSGSKAPKEGSTVRRTHTSVTGPASAGFELVLDSAMVISDWSTLFATMGDMLVVTVKVSGIPTAPTVPTRNSKHIMRNILAVALILFSPASVLYHKVYKHSYYNERWKNEKYLLFRENVCILYLNWYFALA
jgi:hypothetical protein